MKFPLRTSIAAIALFAATPAFALTSVPCDPLLPQPDAVNCVSFAGNLNDGSIGGAATDLNAALDILVGGNFVDQDWSTIIDPTKLLVHGTSGSEIVTFDQALLGDVILSIHFGGQGGGHTTLYWFNFLSPTTSIDFNELNFSNGVIITPPGGAVPEPATWAMMLMGFGAVGYAMRRRRKTYMPQVA